MRAATICLSFILTWGLAAPASGQFSPESLEVFRISTEVTDDDARPSVASDAAGNFVTVWTSKDVYLSDTVILARRYDDQGKPLGDVFQVSTRPGDHSDAVVASDGDGNFVVAWAGRDGSPVRILARCYDRHGIPLGEEIEVAVRDFGTSEGVAVARAAGGDFVVVWTGRDSSDTGIFARRYDPFGLPRGDAFQVNTGESGYQYSVAVVADATGIVVVWTGTDEDRQGIFARRYDRDGQPQGDEFRVNTLTTGRQSQPAVASDPEGNLVIAWRAEDFDGNDRGIFAQRYDGTGQTLGSEFRVDGNIGGHRRPAIARDAAGNFLIAWVAGGIVGQRFSPSGTPQHGIFRIDQRSGSASRSPAVSVDAAGTFVVVYPQSFPSSEDDYHIIGRLLPPEASRGTFHVIGSDAERIEDDTTATVTVWRTGGSAGEVSVDYLTVDGTATAHQDYGPIAGTLTFADGEWTPRLVQVPILEDDVAEGNENLAVQLENPGGGAFLIAPTTAEITIFDDDFGPPGVGPAPLGPAFAVGDEEASDRRAPAVATAASGGVVVVWESRDEEGTELGIFCRSYDAQGVPKGSAFRVSTAAGTEPAVAADADGNFLVAWRQPGSLRGRRFNPAGVPLGDEFEIAADFSVPAVYLEGTVSHPKVARLGGGTDVVVWHESTIGPHGGYVSVYAQRFDGSGVPLGDAIRFIGSAAWFPEVAVAADQAGNFVIAGGLDNIYAQRYDAAAQPQGERFRVDDDPDLLGAAVGMAMDAAGNFVIVWEQDDGVGGWKDIFGRRFAHDGTPLGEPFRVNRTQANQQKRPSVASDAAGNLVVVWDSLGQDGSERGVFGQRFDAQDREVAGEFLVNTITANDQQRPVVASDPQGNLVVVWESEQDDGRFDIVAQRYAPWTCQPDATTLCLGGGRFALQVAWQDFVGNAGWGHPGTLTADTGTFWFFDDANLELVVKVLDGTALNGYYWVFYGALSNVPYNLTVTDQATGVTKEYVNPSGRFASSGDVRALPASPSGGGSAVTSPSPSAHAPAASPESACAGDPTSLCLQDQRFRIEVEWRDFWGNTGVGWAVPLTSDSGYFWFFDDANVELMIKVLDGTALTGHYWVFYGALSNVEYTITVTDTATGEAKTYFNPLEQFASSGDTSAFPGD
ncbi:MAG: hypothetical protein GY856_18280 [bacterium]|nr:hypothetical protein [bacterium]